MGNPIKAFMGKSYTKNGVTKTYMYNPETEKYGWYNVGKSATDYGRSIFREYSDYAQKTYAGDTKAAVLRKNIKTVLNESADSNIEGMGDLLDAIKERIDDMSDYEIDIFSKYNEKSINLYFEYKDITDKGVDARIINIAKSLDIDIYDYIESEDIPDSVKFTLQNINDYVKFDKEFIKNTDKEILDIGLGRKSI